MTIAVRLAREEDAAAIASIHVRGWRAAYGGIVPQDYLDSLRVDEWEQRHRARIRVPDPGVTRWVAEDEGTVVGFAVLGPSREPPEPDAGEIYAVYVDPDRWRRGAGRAMMEAAAEHLRSEGRGVGTLWVLRDNAAGRRFYEAIGWRGDGSVKTFSPPGHEGMDLPEVRYRLPL